MEIFCPPSNSTVVGPSSSYPASTVQRATEIEEALLKVFKSIGFPIPTPVGNLAGASKLIGSILHVHWQGQRTFPHCQPILRCCVMRWTRRRRRARRPRQRSSRSVRVTPGFCRPSRQSAGNRSSSLRCWMRLLRYRRLWTACRIRRQNENDMTCLYVSILNYVRI